MVNVSFTEWLTMRKVSWRVVLDNDPRHGRVWQCSAFGTDVKQVFRNLGRKVLTMHRRWEVNGNLKENVLIQTTDNSITIRNNTQWQESTGIKLMGADINHFIRMVRDLGGYKDDIYRWIEDGDKVNSLFPLESQYYLLPPDFVYFHQLSTSLGKSLSKNYTYDDLRHLEFWLLNYPGFLSLEDQQCFFFLIYDMKQKFPSIFDNAITLEHDPYPTIFDTWATRISIDKENILEPVYKFNPRAKDINFDPADPIVGIYKRNCGVLTFARNCHNHYLTQAKLYGTHYEGNRIQIAEKIQDAFPHLIVKIHYELMMYFPKEEGDINLFDYLVGSKARENKIYTWG